MGTTSSFEIYDTAVKWVLSVVVSWVALIGISWGVYSASAPAPTTVSVDQQQVVAETAEIEIANDTPTIEDTMPLIDVADNTVIEDDMVYGDEQSDDEQPKENVGRSRYSGASFF